MTRTLTKNIRVRDLSEHKLCGYESPRARDQALRESIKLNAVAVLKNHPHGLSLTTLAAAIGQGRLRLHNVIMLNKMTFTLKDFNSVRRHELVTLRFPDSSTTPEGPCP